jgi:hypothetical protein
MEMQFTKYLRISSWYKVFVISFLLLFSTKGFSEEVKSTSNNPSPKTIPVVRQTILDYKTEVGLTDKQAKDIEKLISDFQKREKENRDKIATQDKKVKELLANEGDMKEIAKGIREIYRLRGEMLIDDIETGRKIDNCLTKEQKDKWKEIRKSLQTNVKNNGGEKK